MTAEITYSNEVEIREADSGHLTNGSVVFGDQSPWAGGLVRAAATKAILGDTPVIYCMQNADNPWRQEGNGLKIKEGWPKPFYWNLATRIPNSLEIPEMSENSPLEKMRQSIKSPRGMSYLVGNSTHGTIYSHNSNHEVLSLLEKMLGNELDWAARTSEFMGNKNGVERANALKNDLFKTPKSITELTMDLAERSGVHSGTIDNIVESFRREPAAFIGILPDENYWVINKSGERTTYKNTETISRSDTIVPKGKILPIELAQRGLILGYTGLSYLPEVVEIRDEYNLDVPLRLLQVEFNWTLPNDPIQRMWEAFETKKAARGDVVDKPDNALEAVKAYWAQRPTTLSHLVLGGELNPKLTYREI